MDVRLHLGVDGIAIPLVLLTAAVGLLVMIHALGEVPTGGSPSTFIGSLLLVQTGALATFTARDAVLFFVAFELVLVPMWVLIARFGDPHHPRARADAAARFLLYTVVGSTLMLVGILLLVTATGTADLDALTREGADLPHGQQVLIALLLTIGLAVKVPVFPLHTWLPPAHTTAPTAGSVLLAAVLLKMGTYGLVRLPLATVPDGFALIAPALAIAGVLGIIWGGLVCLVERDLKRLVAFSSVAHMGFVVLALATGTALGLQAALFGNIAHGLVSALLFVIVGGLKSRWGDVDLAILRPALRETAPHRGFLLVMGLAAALGLPGLAVFWGEFFALGAAWSPERHLSVALFRTCAVIGAIGAARAAAYCLRVARHAARNASSWESWPSSSSLSEWLPACCWNRWPLPSRRSSEVGHDRVLRSMAAPAGAGTRGRADPGPAARCNRPARAVGGASRRARQSPRRCRRSRSDLAARHR